MRKNIPNVDFKKLVHDLLSENSQSNRAGLKEFINLLTYKFLMPLEYYLFFRMNSFVPVFVRQCMLKKVADNNDILKTLSVPVLFIRGEHDVFLSVSAFENYLRIIPNVRGLVFKGVGHSPQWEAASLFNETIKDFLKKES